MQINVMSQRLCLTNRPIKPNFLLLNYWASHGHVVLYQAIPRVDPVEALPVAVVHDKVGHEQVGQVILIGTALKSFLEKNDLV